MNARSEFLSNHNELTKTPPTISTISTTPSVVPSYSTANLIVNVEDASYVYLAYRFRPQERFVKVQMFDNVIIMMVQPMMAHMVYLLM